MPANRNEDPPPRALGAEQKNFLFLLEEKINTHKLKNKKKIFLRGRPPSSVAGGGVERVDFFKNF